MNKKLTILYLSIMMCAGALTTHAQNLHFSQYYNTPILVNPANTGLMSDKDYRIGANYRNQWNSVVPYQTFSAYGDCQLFHGEERNNWLGLGFALFNDKAGDGDLSLTRMQVSAAYHLQLGYNSMLSAGFYGGYSQRSVNFSKLTWDSQWDGFSFNSTMATNEPAGIAKTTYFDVGAGLNYAYFPNENVYIKVGAGVSHINQPKESFYNFDNKVGLRPSANVDGLFKISEGLIFNPSAYGSYQQGAYEIVYGTLLKFWLGGEDSYRDELIIGVYHRWNDAIIPAFGFDFGSLRVMANYDYTISKFTEANNGRGGMEISLTFLGNYHGNGGVSNRMNCPRF